MIERMRDWRPYALFALRIAGALALFGAGLIMVRAFPPETSAEIFAILAMISILSALPSLMLDSGIIKIARALEARRDYKSLSAYRTFLRLIFWLVSALILLVAMAFAWALWRAGEVERGRQWLTVAIGAVVFGRMRQRANWLAAEDRLIAATFARSFLRPVFLCLAISALVVGDFAIRPADFALIYVGILILCATAQRRPKHRGYCRLSQIRATANRQWFVDGWVLASTILLAEFGTDILILAAHRVLGAEDFSALVIVLRASVLLRFAFLAVEQSYRARFADNYRSENWAAMANLNRAAGRERARMGLLVMPAFALALVFVAQSTPIPIAIAGGLLAIESLVIIWMGYPQFILALAGLHRLSTAMNLVSFFGLPLLVLVGGQSTTIIEIAFLVAAIHALRMTLLYLHCRARLGINTALKPFRAIRAGHDHA